MTTTGTVLCRLCDPPQEIPDGLVLAHLADLHGWDKPSAAGETGLAREIAAHADPALDAFPALGPTSPCLLCGTGLPQRHRMVDAIADALAAEPDAEDDLAVEYGVPLEAVRAVGEWARRWAL